MWLSILATQTESLIMSCINIHGHLNIWFPHTNAKESQPLIVCFQLQFLIHSLMSFAPIEMFFKH